MTRESDHSLTLKSELVGKNKSELRDAIEEELNERAYELKLDDHYCDNGGSIGDIQIEEVMIDSVNRREKRPVGSFGIYFHESAYRGCKDFEWKEPWKGRAQFSLDLRTSELRFKLEAETTRIERPEDGG